MSSEGWVKAAERSALRDGEVIGVMVAGREIALYEMDGEVFASDDICTHAYAKLSDGWMERDEIECPLHAGRFDIKTGKATAPPCVDDLKTYPARVEGGDIQVKLD
ncbi:MAG TPA: non-heme iron oxygenase ferredoxin subunit [Stellaceae bacterium]|nr:non-heme iron oxygenase ferredoxin subunit [Stellaceae bacterium]